MARDAHHAGSHRLLTAGATQDDARRNRRAALHADDETRGVTRRSRRVCEPHHDVTGRTLYANDVRDGASCITRAARKRHAPIANGRNWTQAAV